MVVGMVLTDAVRNRDVRYEQAPVADVAERALFAVQHSERRLWLLFPLSPPRSPPCSAMSQVHASIPSQPRAKQLRACLLCSIVQTPADFRKHGCPNCEELMQVRSRLHE